MSNFTLSDYKLQAYLLANAPELTRRMLRGYDPESGLDTYVKKLQERFE